MYLYFLNCTPVKKTLVHYFDLAFLFFGVSFSIRMKKIFGDNEIIQKGKKMEALDDFYSDFFTIANNTQLAA